MRQDVPSELSGVARMGMTGQAAATGAIPLGMAISGVASDLSGQNIRLMFLVSAVSMLAITILPNVLSKGYLRFLCTRTSGTMCACCLFT